MEEALNKDVLWIILWDVPCILILFAGLGGLLWFGWHGAWSKAFVCLLINSIVGSIDVQLRKLRKLRSRH